MSKHAEKTNPADRANAFMALPPFEPVDIKHPVGSEEYREELAHHEEAQHYLAQGYEAVMEAAKAAHKYMNYARFNHRNTQLELAAEQNYAGLVLAALSLQCQSEEWGYPTSWTDGIPDEEGYIRVYNAGREEIYAWQGGEMDEVKVDENGIGMRNP